MNSPDIQSAQLQQPHQGQVSAPAPTRNLTIIWDDERQALCERIVNLEGRFHAVELFIAKFQAIEARLEDHAKIIETSSQRINTLEHHLLNLEGSTVQISRN